MMRRYYSPLKIIEIDECPSCAGIWLDTGELNALQNIKLSESELAHLRMQMVEETSGAKIETPPHKALYTYEGRKFKDFVDMIIEQLF